MIYRQRIAALEDALRDLLTPSGPKGVDDIERFLAESAEATRRALAVLDAPTCQRSANTDIVAAALKYCSEMDQGDAATARSATLMRGLVAEIERLQAQMESGNFLTENDKLCLAIERQALEIKERDDEIQHLRANSNSPCEREALEKIGRMKVYPDDKINRMTLCAAIAIAEAALAPTAS